MATLPVEIYCEILKNTTDIGTLLNAIIALGRLVSRRCVKHIRSDGQLRVVPLDFIVSFPNLEYADNIGVRVEYQDLHRLSACPRLRRLAIQVLHAPSVPDTLQTLADVLRVEDKVDDQYWKISIVLECYECTVFIKNRTIATPHAVDIGSLRLERKSIARIASDAYYRLLEEVRDSGDLGPLERKAIDILLKYRGPCEYLHIPYQIYKSDAKRLLEVDCAFHITFELFPYYDIPHAISHLDITHEEVQILHQVGR